MLSTRVKTGLGGSCLIVVGIWCPDLDVPFFGSFSFWHEGIAVWCGLFILAVYGMLGVLVNSRQAVLTAGAIGALGVSALYYHHRSEMSGPFQLTHLSWGWGVLVLGSCLLLVSGVLSGQKKPKVRVSDTTRP